MLRESCIAEFKFNPPVNSKGANEQRQDTAWVLAVKIELSFPKRLKNCINESRVLNI
jgi:hypothetical protein